MKKEFKVTELWDDERTHYYSVQERLLPQMEQKKMLLYMIDLSCIGSIIACQQLMLILKLKGSLPDPGDDMGKLTNAISTAIVNIEGLTNEEKLYIAIQQEDDILRTESFNRVFAKILDTVGGLISQGSEDYRRQHLETVEEDEELDKYNRFEDLEEITAKLIDTIGKQFTRQDSIMAITSLRAEDTIDLLVDKLRKFADKV